MTHLLPEKFTFFDASGLVFLCKIDTQYNYTRRDVLKSLTIQRFAVSNVYIYDIFLVYQAHSLRLSLLEVT